MHVLIRRCGNLIDVAPDEVSATPPEIVDLLSPHLYYDYKRIVRGPAAYDPVSGRHEGVEITPTRLYRLENGRLTTGYGFIMPISRLLIQAGHVPHLLDISPPRDRPDCYNTDWDTVRRTVPFRARQEECLQAIERSEGGIINAAMGFGKTYLFAGLALLYPRARFAIVVDGKDVAYRIIRHLTRFIPNVGFVGDGKYNVSRVTVYSAGSVHHCDGDVDFLVMDECHQLMARVVSEKVGRIFRRSRNFGFSGTPTARMDNAHRKLECLCGEEIFRLLYPEAVELGLVVPIHVRWLPIMMTENPAANKTGVSRMRWGIWRNAERNRLIAEDVRRSVPQDQQALIAVATIEHAVYLWQQLPEFTLAYAQADIEKFRQYHGQGLLPSSFQIMTPEHRDGLRQAFERGELKRAIATDIWSTGVDFAQLQRLYRADARESEALAGQWPGRTSRLFEGKSCAEVVDCLDVFDTALRRKSMTRRTHYRAQGWSEDWPLRRGQLNYV